MKTVEESVVTAMDGSDKELYPFLPYILQDAWELGADPDTIIGLVRKHASDNCLFEHKVRRCDKLAARYLDKRILFEE